MIDANAEYVRMSGYGTLEEIRGRSVAEWTAVHDRARNTEAVVNCMRCGFVRDLQIDYAHADGTIVPALINATVTEVEGRPRSSRSSATCRIANAWRPRLLRSEKLRSVGVLAGGIAHDFNNILTAILGNISLLQASFAADDAASEHLDEVEKASQRARELNKCPARYDRAAGDTLLRRTGNYAMRQRPSWALLSLRFGAALPSRRDAGAFFGFARFGWHSDRLRRLDQE